MLMTPPPPRYCHAFLALYKCDYNDRARHNRMEDPVKTYQHFIAGQYVDPLGGKWIDSMDPYRGEAWARIPQGCARDVDRAVTAAGDAMKGPWSKLTPSARGKLMLKLADLVTA